MNNKELNELFDIEAMTEALWELTRCQTPETAKELLKAATKDREYQLAPEVRDWDGVEPLKVGMRVTQVGSNKGYWRIAAIGSGTCACYVGKTKVLTTLATSNLKPIPRIKKIDHSSLVGSGIDCEYEDGGGVFYHEYAGTMSFKSIRINHPMLLTEKQINAIPDGYDIRYKAGELFNDASWIHIDAMPCEIDNDRLYVVKVTIADGWEL